MPGPTSAPASRGTKGKADETQRTTTYGEQTGAYGGHLALFCQSVWRTSATACGICQDPAGPRAATEMRSLHRLTEAMAYVSHPYPANSSPESPVADMFSGLSVVIPGTARGILEPGNSLSDADSLHLEC